MAVTIDKQVMKKYEGELRAFPVASGETIYSNTLVGINASGYLVNITSSNSNAIRLVGVVADDSYSGTPTATTTNGSISGSLQATSAVAGDKTVRQVWTKGTFLLTTTSITQAMVGLPMYATDNFTVDDNPAGVKIGTLETYISATSGWIAINQYYNANGSIELRGSLTALAAGGAILNVLNPTGRDLLVEELILNVGTGSTGAATGDFGITTTGASSDILLDGTNLQTTGYHTIGVLGGTNGKYGRTWSSTTYLTGTGSAATTGLVATYTAIVRIIA